MCSQNFELASAEQPQKLRLTLKQFLKEYSSNCSIHGIKYIFSDKRNWFTRFFWATAVCLAFILSGNLLFKSYVKLNFEPEIGTRSEIMNVRDIPFPSITVCPQTKSKVEFLSFKNIYRDYWQHFKLYGTSDENAARFESLLHVCEPELSYGLELNETKVQTSEEIVKRLKEISYSLDDTMLFCKFRGSFVNCSNLFTEFVTRHGICFSFNFLNFKKAFTDACSETFEPAVATKNVSWRLDEGYETDDLNSYPYPIISQREDALRIILMTKDVDQDYVCAGTSQGFKVYLYLPGDYPGMNGKYLFVPINHDVSAAMNVQVTRTEENLKTYEPKQRKCYLSHERPLKFFRTYSRNYCGLECYANYTLRACGCVHFWMPHDNSTNICDYTQINCTLHAKRNMMLGFKVKDSNEPECDCLPSCTEIRYELESYQTDFDFEKLFESYRYDLSDMPGVMMSRLTVYFQEPQFVMTERYVIFTFRDYLAACGGVLGLFMGFSILSFFEFIYYCICLLSRVRASCH